MSSPKPFASLSRQIEILSEERSLPVADDDAARKYLYTHNYYRFSGYFRFWQINPNMGNNRFHRSASFGEIVRIAETDSKMRALLFEGISHIEVVTRSVLAYELAKLHQENAPGFYLNRQTYLAAQPYPSNSSELQKKVTGERNQELEDKIQGLIDGILRDLSGARSASVKHYAQEKEPGIFDYSNTPIWVAVEYISFGKLSKMIELLANREPIRFLAQTLGVPLKELPETIRAFSVLRNMCAHHAQLWNRHTAAHFPKIKRAIKDAQFSVEDKSPYMGVISLKHLLQRVKPSDSVVEEIENLLAENKMYRIYFCQPVGLKFTVWDNSFFDLYKEPKHTVES